MTRKSGGQKQKQKQKKKQTKKKNKTKKVNKQILKHLHQTMETLNFYEKHLKGQIDTKSKLLNNEVINDFKELKRK